MRFCLARGFARFILKCDQEPAIISLVDTVRNVLAEEHGRDIAVEHSPVSASQSNGFIEGAVRIIKGMVRTLRYSVEELHGVRVGTSRQILPWLVRYAGAIHSRAQRDENGRTAYELWKGKPYRRQLARFSENILYLPSGKLQSRLHDRWMEGLYYGLQDASDEILVGTQEGVMKARSFKVDLPRCLDRWTCQEFTNFLLAGSFP